jgi:hypothetical protein
VASLNVLERGFKTGINVYRGYTYIGMLAAIRNRNMIRILPLIFLTSLLNAQNFLINKSEYDHLVIVDEENINYSIIFGRIFKVNLNGSIHELKHYQDYKSQDSLTGFYRNRIPNWQLLQTGIQNRVIDTIATEIIDSIIYLINHPTGFSGVTRYLGIDSVWHANNKDQLKENWITSLGGSHKDKIEMEYGLYLLDDWRRFYELLASTLLQTNTSDYSNMVIAFENSYDTLMLNSYGQEYFQIPWKHGTTYVNYNPALSVLISGILPNDIVINKNQLNPKMSELIERVIRQLSFKVNFVNRKQFKKILRERNGR